MRASTFAGLAALLLAASCGPDPVTLPTPPFQEETAALVASYDSPTGTFDTTEFEETIDRAQQRVEELQLDWLPELMSQMLARLDQRLDASGLTDDPDTTTDDKKPIIDAVAEVHRICQGWVDPPGPPDPATNGTLEFTAVVQDGRLQRDAWGVASNCHARVLPVGQRAFDGFIDGTLVVHLYGPLAGDLASAKFLFYMTGTLGVEDRTTSGTRDFRIIDGQVEFRLEQPDGFVVVSVGPTLIGVRDRITTYGCDLVARTCGISPEAPAP